MTNELDIYDVTKKYLESLYDNDLLALGIELNRAHDRDCTWAVRYEVSEEMWMHAESALYKGDVRAILDAMEWAQRVKGCDYLDEYGDPVTDADMLERARDNIDELADLVSSSCSSYDGTPDVYMAIDTDELLSEWQKTREWQEEYGDYDEEEW